MATGAGANIALACDIVIAGESASFIQSFNRLGLMPDSGGSWILPRLVGHARAVALTMLGTKVNALEEKVIGMISQVVADDKLSEEAQRLGKTLANTLEQQLIIERDSQSIASKTDDYAEGVNTFNEKRTAIFRGC